MPMLFLVCCVLTICACDTKKQYSSGKENKKTKISFWNGFTGPDGQTMWQIIKKFEQDFPQYEVEMEIIPWSTYFDKLMVSLGSGKPPDVFILHENELLNYVQQDAIRSLDNLVSGERGIPVSDCLAPIWERVTINGNICVRILVSGYSGWIGLINHHLFRQCRFQAV